MHSKKIIGIVLIVIGVAMFIFSNSISNQVAEGRGEISSAQSQVDTGNTLFSMTPETKQVGKVFTGSAQDQINAGSAKADYYERMAHWLKIGGVVIALIGVGCMFCCCRKKSR
ncbi:MAG TPA: hypothetical protein VIJ46_05795 [Rhabdochlamydiaceae bacterium]